MRLIFHIGLGKTGTSSIQRTLRDSGNCLQQFGYAYWGLMLELAPIQKYSWQKAGVPGFREFRALDEIAAEKQLFEILSGSIKVAKDNGIHTAIWSHEAFAQYRPQSLVLTLKKLQQQGIDLQIVAYIRNHASWIQSAYFQWGINHKAYPGKIKTFKEYIQEKPINFADTILPWKNEFKNVFFLRNFDYINDVVADFLRFINFPEQKIKPQRIYERLSHEEILLRALFNNNISTDCLPDVFDRAIKLESVNMLLKPSEWLQSLLPQERDIEDILSQTTYDREIINSILAENEQPPLASEPQTKQINSQIDQEVLLGILSQIVLLQSHSIRSLHERIERLENA